MRPKTVVGDLMAILMVDGLAFAGRADWQVGPWTTLHVLVQQGHKPATALTQFAHIREQITAIQPHLRTGNATIGRILLNHFRDLPDLQAKLMGGISTSP